jgi:hypothetical protein
VPYKRAGSRIAEVQGKPDVRQITSDVLETGVGRIAICGKLCHFLLLQYFHSLIQAVCAHRQMRHQAQDVVARTSRKRVRYRELDFQPFEARRSTREKRSLPIKCRGIEAA